jgi:catechol 2,3-dioxygenase-like lactoylglutathione lyase family enzyme
MAKQLFPMIVVPDPARAAQWYRDRLGFEPVASLGWYEHLRDPEGHELGFLVAGVEGQPDALTVASTGTGFALSFEVEDLDATWRAWGAAADVLQAPTREAWGQHHFVVRDAAGLVVDVIEVDTADADGDAP